MTQLVQLPDGSVVEFPDGTPPGEMQRAIEGHLGAQDLAGGQVQQGAPQGVLPTLARVPLGVLSAAAKGVASTAAQMGPLGSILSTADLIGKGLGVIPPSSPAVGMDMTPLALSATHALGLTDRADLAPQSAPERVLYGATSGAAGALPLLAAGPVGPLLASGASSGAAAALAHEISPESSILPMLAGVAGGLAGGGLATAGQRGFAAATGGLSPAGQLFADSGLPMRSPVLTSQSPATRSMLGPYAPMAQTQADIGAGIETQASKLGPERTLQAAGARLQDEAQTWLTNVKPQKEAAAWAPVDAAVPPDTPVPLGAFTSTLRRINTSAGGLQSLVEKLQPVLPKQLEKALSQLPTQLTGGQPTWQEVRVLRSALGDAMSQPKIASDLGQENLKALYAATTQDMRGATRGIDSLDPNANATQAFDQANATSTRLNQFAEGVLGKVVKSKQPGQEGIKPEDAANAMLAPSKRGGSLLQALRLEMPDATDALAAAHLRLQGLADAQDSTSSMHQAWPQRWQALSPEAKAALIPDPLDRATVDAQARIGALTKSPGAASPGTWGHAFVGGQAGGAIGALADLAGSHLLGLPGGAGAEIGSGAAGELIGMALPAASRAVRARLANSPLLARYAGARSPDWLLSQPADLSAAAALGALPSALSVQPTR